MCDKCNIDHNWDNMLGSPRGMYFDLLARITELEKRVNELSYPKFVYVNSPEWKFDYPMVPYCVCGWNQIWWDGKDSEKTIC